MTKPPLLPSLGIIAVLGAMFFLAFTHASLDSENLRQPPRRTSIVQALAFTAAARAAENSPNPPAAPVTYAEAGRVKAARRDFLSRPENWLPEKRQELQFLSIVFYDLGPRWDQYPFLSEERRTSSTRTLTHAGIRGHLDKFAGDLTKMTPAARGEWESWEAVGWKDYPLHLRDPALRVPDIASAAPQERAAADFRARCVNRAGPLRDELEHLEDLTGCFQKEIERLMAAGQLDTGLEPLLPEFRRAGARLNEVSRELDEFTRHAVRQRQLWEQAGWEGYPPPPAD